MVRADNASAQWRREADNAMAAGDLVVARRSLERLWEGRPGAASAVFIEQRRSVFGSSRSLARLKVVLLRSFTIEPLVPLLRSASLIHGLDLDIEVGGFNTFGQELLDTANSFLYADPPDVVVCAVQARDIASDLWASFSKMKPDDVDRAVDRVTAELEMMFETFRSASSTPIVVHAMELPSEPARGVADDVTHSGQREAFRRINRGLRELAERLTDTHVLDLDRVISRVGSDNWHDEAKWTSMKMPIRSAAMPGLVDEWLRYLVPISGQSSKALIVDLDNTMWGGVVGEAGIDGIDLDPDRPSGAGYLNLQRTLIDLRARGVLLGICSKNNEADAMEVLLEHGQMLIRLEDFSAVRVDWNTKADNLRSIADELNIGLDSIAFLDDNPAECDQMRRLAPEVTVIELHSPPTERWNPLVGHPRFERLAISTEDQRRPDMYADQKARTASLETASSLGEYLTALETRVLIAPLAEPDVARAAQLTQKTNQFNLTTMRYTETEIERFRAGCHTDVLGVRAADRFGDHGLIGLAIVESDAATMRVDSFLLSCRVIGRGVETALLAFVVERAHAAGLERVEGEYAMTPKNGPCAGFYPSHGFNRSGGDDTITCWELEVALSAVSCPEWIEDATATEPENEE